MRTRLVLRRPWKQPPETWWSFSGADDQVIRDAVAALSDFQAYPGDAALVLFEEEGGSAANPTWPIGAWTRAGAVRLAELLPDELAGVRDDLRAFGSDAA